MPRPIDADRLYNEILSMNIYVGGKQIFHPDVKQSVLDSIEMSETIDYAPVVHGEWEDGAFENSKRCTRCGLYASKIYAQGTAVWDYRYCPNCGALMDGKEDAHG